MNKDLHQEVIDSVESRDWIDLYIACRVLVSPNVTEGMEMLAITMIAKIATKLDGLITVEKIKELREFDARMWLS